MADIIKRNDPQLQKAITRFGGITSPAAAEREASFALQLVNKNALLQKCSTQSIIESFLNVANVGLTLNPALNFAYLVPRYDRAIKSFVCTLMPSYQGLVKLLTDTGAVTSVSCHLYRDGDEFEFQLGTDAYVNHRPKIGNKGEVLAVYAVATMPDGGKQIEIMAKEEIDSIRDLSDSWKAYMKGKISSCVWLDHYGEMARKTVVKRMVKYLPKSKGYDLVAKAIEQDNQDYTLDPFSRKAEYITSLCDKIYGSNDIPAYQEIRLRIANGMTLTEADELIERLKVELPNQVTHGDLLPGQKAISESYKENVE